LSRFPPPLVEVEELAPLLAPQGAEASARPADGLCLIHVAEAAAYQQAHLPGALLVEPRELVNGRPPAPGRLPETDRLQALFDRLGHTPERHYVVYDDEGGGWAGRFVWTLDVIGHRRWSYLNGGLAAWHDAGLPLDAGPPEPPASGDNACGTRVEIAPDAPIAEVDDVLAAIDDPDQIIWDVRSAEEYRGERSGSRRAGHVPTARHLDWMRLKDPTRSLRLTENLPSLLEAHGIQGTRPVITHCQSHHRSGLSYLVGRLLGFRDIRAFHGSWAEWGNREDTPVTTGDEPGNGRTAQKR
jgi:thiosulfate/3-mercaptopyruvate sulfurtransferase